MGDYCVNRFLHEVNSKAIWYSSRSSINALSMRIAATAQSSGNWGIGKTGVSVRMSVPLHLSRNKVTRLDVCMSSLRRGHTGCHNREHICNRISRARAKTKATLRTPILKLSEFKIVAGEFASLVSTCFARQHTDPTFSVGFFLQATAITPHV